MVNERKENGGIFSFNYDFLRIIFLEPKRRFEYVDLHIYFHILFWTCYDVAFLVAKFFDNIRIDDLL